MLNPLISIIVPVYNNEALVERCLLSIIAQTYKNIEIIVVNDGSTDNSEGKILAIKDERIKYFYQNNSGPSVARNKGLDFATGEYIAFIDSDDYIEVSMFEKMLNLALSNDAEIVSCDIYKKISENKIINVKEPYAVESTWQDFFRNFVLNNGLCSLWNKLFKRELFNNVRLYEDIRLGEDSSALLRILPKAKKIMHLSEPLYVYDLTHEGISRNAKKNVYEYMIAIRRVEDFYLKNKLEFPVQICMLHLKICYYTLYFCPLWQAKKIGYWDYFKLAEDFYNDFFSIIKSRRFRKIAMKFKFFMFLYNALYFSLYRKTYKLHFK